MTCRHRRSDAGPEPDDRPRWHLRDANTSNNGRTASGIVNAGTINAGLSGGSFTIQGSGSFTNQGTITSNGDRVDIKH